MRALRAVSTEKGRDPADFVLLAYGGSGPVHAAALAAELGVRTAIVPPLAGLFSAAGLLFARAEFHDVRFCRVNARDPDLDLLERVDADMRESLTAAIGRRVRVEWQRSADVRYRGQNWSVTIDFPGAIDAEALAGLVERFEAEHERLYGTRLEPGSPVDIRAVRLIALGPPREEFSLPGASDHPLNGSRPTRLANFGPRHGTLEVSILPRSSLGAEPVVGPLLVDEYDTTVVVPPGWTVRVDSPRTRSCSTTSRSSSRMRSRAGRGHMRPRSRAGWSRTRSRRPPTRWRRRSSAPRTRRSSATRWTSRPRSAARPARRSRRR